MSQEPSTTVESDLLCPSARCEEGAVLLGVVGGDGTVGYIRPLVTIDQEFVDRAKQGRDPEKRFRFAQPCIEGKCAHWRGQRCGVIDQGLEFQEDGTIPRPEQPLPKCSIRPSCRWFAQVGPRACSVCPLVVTDVSEGMAHSEA